MAARFSAFGSWLKETIGEHQAAIKIHRYLLFFVEIERQWETIPEYTEMLSHFSTAALRRVLLPMRWLEQAGLVVTNELAKADDSERRRIANDLERFKKGTEAHGLLAGYHSALMERLKAGKMTLPSIRMALSPAVALLNRAIDRGRMPPDQGVLDAYLAETPGQRASISGFVRHLREAHEATISMPKRDPGRVQRLRRKKLETELMVQMRECGGRNLYTRRWLSAALAYFYGLPRHVVGTDWRNSLSRSEDGDGLIFSWDGHEYWLRRNLHHTP